MTVALVAKRIIRREIVDLGKERVEIAGVLRGRILIHPRVGVLLGQVRLRDQRRIVGHSQVFEHLLRHLGKHWRGNRGSVVRRPLLGVVDDHRNGDDRVIDRRNSDERCDVHRLRIKVSRRIDLLRGAGLAPGG